MKIEIKIKQGKLTLNGNTLAEMNYNERIFLNNYIKYVKNGK